MLAKVSTVTYKIQRCAGAEPEIVHVDKLMPYQADSGEELESWLQDEESGERRAKGTQTSTPASAETSPGLVDRPSSGVADCPFDPGPEDGTGNDAEDESPSVSANSPRRSHRPRQEPDRYTEVRSVRSVPSATNSLVPSLLSLVGFLLVVTVIPSPDVAVQTAMVTAAGVSVVCMSFSPQLKVPSWIRWWADPR